MTTILVEVAVPISAERRTDLQRACQRLGLSWPEIERRVQCAMQDAATREMMKLIRPQTPGAVTMTPLPAFDPAYPAQVPAPCGGVGGESAALLQELDGLSDELQALVQRLNALRKVNRGV